MEGCTSRSDLVAKDAHPIESVSIEDVGPFSHPSVPWGVLG